jgi:hypothetical protein
MTTLDTPLLSEAGAGPYSSQDQSSFSCARLNGCVKAIMIGASFVRQGEAPSMHPGAASHGAGRSLELCDDHPQRGHHARLQSSLEDDVKADAGARGIALRNLRDLGSLPSRIIETERTKPRGSPNGQIERVLHGFFAARPLFRMCFRGEQTHGPWKTEQTNPCDARDSSSVVACFLS